MDGIEDTGEAWPLLAAVAYIVWRTDDEARKWRRALPGANIKCLEEAATSPELSLSARDAVEALLEALRWRSDLEATGRGATPLGGVARQSISHDDWALTELELSADLSALHVPGKGRRRFGTAPYVRFSEIEVLAADVRRLWPKFDPANSEKAKIGRPEKYDWEAARKHAFELMEYWGLPQANDPEWKQADLERAIAIFMTYPDGTAPSTERVRTRVRSWINEYSLNYNRPRENDVRAEGDK